MAKLHAIPVTLHEANSFVRDHHRHNKPVRGARFSVGASVGGALVGVAIVGRPVARRLQDGFTAEVLRVCVLDDAPKGTCSFLYARAWRIWQMWGGLRMITYTLTSEGGHSLKGLRELGWKSAAAVGGSNTGWLNRPGREYQPVYGQQKIRWEVAA